MLDLRLIAQLILGLALSLPVMGGVKSSPIEISPSGDVLAVVNSDSRSISLLELSSSEVIKEIFVGRDPRGLSFDADGENIYVANRLDDSISVIDTETMSVIETIEVPDEPFAVLASPDGPVYVSCKEAGVIAVIDPDSGAITGSIETEIDPAGLAISPDGTELYVIHFTTGRFSIINTSSLEVEAVISTGADTNLSNSITLNQDGSLAYIPQTRSNASNPALLFDTTVFPVVSVIDLDSRTHVQANRIHLDISDEPVNMPFDAALVGENTIYILNSGSNDVSVIDLESSTKIDHFELGDNPVALALTADEGILYISNKLSGTVTTIETGSNSISGETEVTRIPLPPSVLNGKKLFHSSDTADLARDQWISCATCHFDGELDHRTWFFPDGLRNTTSLLGVADTLPVHWSGDLDELQDVEITVRDIQAGTGLAEGDDNCDPACDQDEPNAGRSQDLDDLAEFMATLDLSPNPYLESDGSLGEAAMRGKALFESAEAACATCHIAPLYLDGLKHDVGTGEDPGERKGMEFDTPSLRGIYKTQPYLHHGFAETLLDILTTQNPDDKHGKTSHLGESELQDLVAFLQSIGTGAAFTINAGLNDAWVNADAPFQGLFITVYPQTGILFLSWFTFDSVPPGVDVEATFGAPDQRWITAVGPISGDKATLKAELTTGGVFNASVPLADQDTDYGTIEVEFTDCRSGILRYSFPSVGLSGEFMIARVLDDNLGLCRALSD